MGCHPYGRTESGTTERLTLAWEELSVILGTLGPFPLEILPGWPPCLMDPRMLCGPSCQGHDGRSWLEGRGLSVWPTGEMLPPRGSLGTLQVNFVSL